MSLAAGAWFFSERRTVVFASGLVGQHSEVAAIPNGESMPAFSSEAEMLTAIMSALSGDEPLFRAHRLHELLAPLDSAQLALLFSRALQVDDRDRRGLLLNALLARWAALDPAIAALAVRPYCQRFRAGTGSEKQSLDFQVIKAWALARPELALAEAMAAPQASWAWATARAALKGLAEGDPARQLEALARLPVCRLRAELCVEAIKALAEIDSAAAEERLGLLPEAGQRARLQSEILGKLTARDPAAGLARLATLAPDLKPGMGSAELLTTVLRAAAKQDAPSALAAVEGLPEDLQTQALGAALSGWAGEHPVDALEWATAHGLNLAETNAVNFTNGRNTGWCPLLNTAFGKDHAQTLAWLLTQPPSPMRDRLLSVGLMTGRDAERLAVYPSITPEGRGQAAADLIQSFGSWGVSAAEIWVKDLPLGAERAAAVESLASTQALRAHEEVDTVATAWLADPDRNAALLGIASTLAVNSPQRALDFAQRLENSSAREATFLNIARSWLWKDESSARGWLLNTPELSTESKRVLLRQFEER